MANSKISKLPNAGPLQDSDIIPIVQTSGTESETRKTTINSLQSSISFDRIVSNNKLNTIISDNFGLKGILGSSYYYTFEFDTNKSVIYNPRQSAFSATRERLLSFDIPNNQFILGERNSGRIIQVDYSNNNFRVSPFGTEIIFSNSSMTRISTQSNNTSIEISEIGAFHFGFPNTNNEFHIMGFDTTNGIPKIRVSANGQNYYIPLSI